MQPSDPDPPEPLQRRAPVDPTEVTRLLRAVGSGSDGAEDALLAAVYAELRDLAGARMRREAGLRTLQATALVHEAWLRLRGAVETMADRRHFFGAAARVMRQILVERCRRARQRAAGREAAAPNGDLDDMPLTASDEVASLDLLALDEALDALEAHDPRMAQVVQLRYFAGLSVEDAAAALEVSPRTVKREWAVARAWLFRRMS